MIPKPRPLKVAIRGKLLGWTATYEDAGRDLCAFVFLSSDRSSYGDDVLLALSDSKIDSIQCLKFGKNLFNSIFKLK